MRHGLARCQFARPVTLQRRWRAATSGREALPESFGQSSMLTKPFTQEQLVEAATQLIQLRQVARVAHIASYQRQVREEQPAPAVALRTGKLRRKFQLRTLSSLLRVLVVKTPACHDSVG
jgi:hypothetical protein